MHDRKSHRAHAKARGRRHRILTGGVAVVGSAGLAAAVLLPAGPALTAYQQRPDAPPAPATPAYFFVGLSEAVSFLTTSFTLTGVPGDHPTATVTYNVYSDNATGYTVSATATGDLVGTTDDTEIIPVDDLYVADTSTGATGADTTAQPLADGAPVEVHSQDEGSFFAGNNLSTTFSFPAGIPDATSGTYTDTIDYTVMANP